MGQMTWFKTKDMAHDEPKENFDPTLQFLPALPSLLRASNNHGRMHYFFGLFIQLRMNWFLVVKGQGHCDLVCQNPVNAISQKRLEGISSNVSPMSTYTHA